MNLEIKHLEIKNLRIGFRVRAFLTKAFLTASAVLCALPVAHASTCEDVFAQEAGKATRKVRETKETKANKQAPISEQELSSFISENLMKTPEFQSVREVAQELGVRVWLFGGTASSFVHYAKEALLNQKGLKKLQIDRLNWDFTDIFRSTQDLDIVVDGSREKINQLQEILLEKYPFFLGSKTGWEVRSLKDPSGTPGQFGYKEALLNDSNFSHQNTDSHSLAMVEVTQSKDPVVRDLKHWDSPQGEGQFLSDAIKGDITYYRNPRHFETERAKLGENPEIMSVVRVLIKAFQYDLKISQEARKQIQKIIHEFDPSTLTDVAAQQLEKIVKKLVMHAVNIEYALKELDALELRQKLIEMGDKEKKNSSSWWINKAALESFEVGKGNGRTAKALEIDIVAHETNDFLSYESITRAHSGQPNVLISRKGFSGENAYIDGFYTRMGRQGGRGTGLTIRFKVNPKAREGTDFIKEGDFIIFQNKNALKVIPESLNFSAETLFEIIKNPKEFNIDHSDKALWEKFLRKIDADYMKADLLRFFKSSNLTPLENLKLIDKFFSSSMPEKLKQFLLVFVYKNDSIIPKDLRLKLLSEHAKYIPETAKGEKILLREIEGKAQDPIENLELMSNFFSSSMPEKLKQSLLVFVYENDSIIPKDSRLKLLSEYAKYIPETAKGEKLLLKELRNKSQNPLEKPELVDKIFSSSMPEKLKQSLIVFVYENDFIIPKDSRLSFLSKHIDHLPVTARGEEILLKEITDNKQNLNKTSLKGKDKDLNLLFLHASRNRLHKVVKELLKSEKIDVNIQDRDGDTALMNASRYGYIEIVKTLLEAKGINLKNKSKNMTPLLHASREGHTEIVKILIKAGSDVNSQNLYGFTALISASYNNRVDIVKILLGVKGIKVNHRLTENGDTALTMATEYGHVETVKILLEAKGIDVNVKTEYEGTALTKANRRGYKKIIKLLKEAGAE